MPFNRMTTYRSTLWIGACVAIVASFPFLGFGQDELDDEVPDESIRMVLLTTGRMLTGQVTRNAGGYLIEQENGRIQIPANEVKFVCRDLREMYRKQRDSIVEPTPATHVALAKWCITYDLYEDARNELKICLKADPQHRDALRLLNRLTDTLRKDLPPKAEPPAVRKTIDGFNLPEVESLGGLSRDTATLFTTRVQPILINKCGNASCHGAASSNAFHILPSRVAGRGSSQNSQRNLAEVLKYIETDDVARSELLTALRGAHGGRGPVFQGKSANDNIKTIRSWVVAVVDEKLAEEAELQQRPKLASRSRTKHRVTQASAMEPHQSSSNAFDRHDRPDSEPPELVETLEEPRLRPLDRTDAAQLAAEPEDAFDPEEFNQRYRRP
ncbi:hypothetical protein [Schlesneria paludicola]|uniref:hypothetical protein n=1 Tax=Schlesneria paludicola TaxID=360056 RepID=UPI00029AAB13|nr:hypothetical protein [Schlesneria paludicola]